LLNLGSENSAMFRQAAMAQLEIIQNLESLGIVPGSGIEASIDQAVCRDLMA